MGYVQSNVVASSGEVLKRIMIFLIHMMTMLQRDVLLRNLILKLHFTVLLTRSIQFRHLGIR